MLVTCIWRNCTEYQRIYSLKFFNFRVYIDLQIEWQWICLFTIFCVSMLFWQRDTWVTRERISSTIVWQHRNLCTSTRCDVGDYNETLCRLHQKRSVQNRIHRVNWKQQQTHSSTQTLMRASIQYIAATRHLFCMYAFIPIEMVFQRAFNTFTIICYVRITTDPTKVLLQCSTLAIVCVQSVTNVFKNAQKFIAIAQTEFSHRSFHLLCNLQITRNTLHLQLHQWK